MKQRLYLETTTIGYLTARTSGSPIVAGRQALNREWWEHRRTAFDLVVSRLVFDEAAAGNPKAAKRRLDHNFGYGLTAYFGWGCNAGGSPRE